MPFTIVCNNKGCGDIMEPYLESETNKVYCSKCDKELSNITPFIKSQMKQFKQFKPKKQMSFSVKCNNCKHEARPIIHNNEITCPSCKKSHTHLSEPFKIMLKDNLKKINQDV